MDLIKWNDKKMSIGIKLIDDEHKQLLQIINDLSISIHKNCQKEEIVSIVDRLIDYSKYHFAREEKYFDEFNYEDATAHKHQHELFINKFEKIKNKIKLEDELCNIILTEEVFLYLVKWLLNHISGSDRKYVKLFKQNGLQ